MKLFIAVVLKAGKDSQRHDGDWASFVNKDKKAAINAAVKARTRWEKKDGCGPYQIFVGVLTQQVNTTVTLKLAAIKEPKPAQPARAAAKNAILAYSYAPVGSAGHSFKAYADWTAGYLKD